MKRLLYIFILLTSVSAVYSQAVYSELNAISGCSNATTVATTSITIAANDLVIVYVQNRDGTTAPTEATISGGGVATWVKITTVLANGNTQRMTVYRGISTGNTGAITATWATNQNQRLIQASKFTGVPITNNGADAILQSATNTGSDSSPIVTLSSISEPRNAVVLFGGGGGTTTLSGTPETGFTEIRDDYSTICFAQHRWIYTMVANTTDNTPTVTTTSSLNWGAIGIEVKANIERRIMIIN